jgi:NhaA family Na+:H+ antiporter
VLSGLSWTVVLGIVLGLVGGKVIGICAMSFGAIATGAAALPAQTTKRSLFAISWLGGIGFTMSLFVATLAFGSGPLLDSAKVGILAASACAGGIGAAMLAFDGKRLRSG